MKRHAEISIQTLRDSTSQEDSHGTELDALIEQDGVLFPCIFHVFSNVFSNVLLKYVYLPLLHVTIGVCVE